MPSLVSEIIFYLEVMMKMPYKMAESLTFVYAFLAFEALYSVLYVTWYGPTHLWWLVRILFCWTMQNTIVMEFRTFYMEYFMIQHIAHYAVEKAKTLEHELHASGLDVRVPSAIVSVPWCTGECPICLEPLEPSVAHVVAVAADCPGHHEKCPLTATRGGCHATCWVRQNTGTPEATCPLCRINVPKIVYCR